ncbi:MAG: hypothetical protein AB1449_03360 [Chloroflexota bacterium]
MHMRGIVLAVSVLGAAVLACAAPGTTVTVSEDEIATRVAATMTAAVAEPGGPSGSAVPHEPVTEEASPTPEPLLRVTYTDGGNAWLYKEGGAPAQVTTSDGVSDVRLSDDGALIAFIHRETPDGHGELRVIRADGSGETVLLTAADLDAMYPLAEYIVGTDISMMEFVPGTHTLVFNTYAIPEFVGFMKYDDLWAIDADSGTLTRLLPGGSGGDFSISPDGTQIALTRPTSISLINADGTNLRPDLVTFPNVITYSEFLYYPDPVWRPDSSAVGVVIPSEDPLSPAASGAVWCIPAGGGPAVLVGTVHGDVYFPSFGGPLIPRDLGRVAFIRSTGAPGGDTLYIANSDGSGEVSYASGSIQWEGWSPDGVHFVYRADGPMTLQLGTIGAAPTPLGSGMSLRWVNSLEFVYLSGSSGSWTLMLGTIGGGSLPLASPAGDSVAFDFTE